MKQACIFRVYNKLEFGSQIIDLILFFRDHLNLDNTESPYGHPRSKTGGSLINIEIEL